MTLFSTQEKEGFCLRKPVVAPDLDKTYLFLLTSAATSNLIMLAAVPVNLKGEFNLRSMKQSHFCH